MSASVIFHWQGWAKFDYLCYEQTSNLRHISLLSEHKSQPEPLSRDPREQHGPRPPEGPEGDERSLHVHGLQHRGGHRQQPADLTSQMSVSKS